MNLQLPEKLAPLFEPHRYKFVRGGRGSAKSWGVARALLTMGTTRPERILCTREVQKSIKQSVHQLLRDQIAANDELRRFYSVIQDREIRGINGTSFFFAGLSDLTADSIKSFEGLTKIWNEEGQTTSRRSWKIMTPTIRTEGSEIWTTYNPDLDSDETHVRAVVQPHPDTCSIEMNWRDNPWFPDVLNKDRLHDLATLPRWEYENIWEGKCRPAVAGAIYADQMAEAVPRIVNLPHDPLLKTHVVFDLGFNDSMSIGLVQKLASEVRVIHYIEDTQRTLPEYSAQLRELRLDGQPMNWGTVYLPHDGFAKRHQTGKMDAEVLRGLGWTVAATPQMDVESGIKRAREIFGRVYFHAERTARLVECLKRYRRGVSQVTKEPGAPVHDQYSHGADMFRYLALNVDAMRNEDAYAPVNYGPLGIV